MEYYNEFKLTMETNAKAKEASEILVNRLNKGFEIDNTYRFNPSSKMAQVISANDNTVTLDGYDGYYTVEDSEEVFFELIKVLAENLSEDTFSCEIINNSTYSEGTINTSFSNGILTINSVYYPEGYTEYLCCDECGENIVKIDEYDASKTYFCEECGEEVDLQEQYENCKPIITEKVIAIK